MHNIIIKIIIVKIFDIAIKWVSEIVQIMYYLLIEHNIQKLFNKINLLKNFGVIFIHY